MKFQKTTLLLFPLLIGLMSSASAQPTHWRLPANNQQQLQEPHLGDHSISPFGQVGLPQGPGPGDYSIQPFGELVLTEVRPAGQLTHKSPLVQGVRVPPGFQVTLITDGLDRPQGIDSALNNAGGGPMSDALVVAESGQNQLVRVSRDGLSVTHFANTMGVFPVGLACYGGPFSQCVYVGNAMGSGIERVDSDGDCVLFSAPGLGIAGLDFGRGQFGNFLYASEWAMGKIWCIHPDGAMTLFAHIPGGQARYLKFSRGGQFGKFLYVTDFTSGDIWRVDKTGAPTWFTSTGSAGLEGLAFSPGGAFGKFLYTGNLQSGEIYQVAPDGTVSVFASGFPGVSDLIFEPGGAGGFTMYLVDGVSAVFAIRKV